MLPLVVSFGNQGLALVFLQDFEMVNLARVLCYECASFQDVQDVHQIFLLGKLFDVSHEHIVRNVCQRV